MDNKFGQRIVSALAYFSIFFLPVIFPLIVWIIAKYQGFNEVRKNAVKAFWSQIFPLLYMIAIFVIIGAANMQNLAHLGGLFSILAAFALLLALVLLIYNVAMGIAVLLGRKPQSPGILVYKSVILVSALRQGFFILAY